MKQAGIHYDVRLAYVSVACNHDEVALLKAEEVIQLGMTEATGLFDFATTGFFQIGKCLLTGVEKFHYSMLKKNPELTGLFPKMGLAQSAGCRRRPVAFALSKR